MNILLALVAFAFVLGVVEARGWIKPRAWPLLVVVAVASLGFLFRRFL